MAATVIWTTSAVSDVERVLEHISIHSEYYAADLPAAFATPPVP